MLDQPKKVPVFNSSVHLLPNYSEWLWQCLTMAKGGQIITLNAEMAMLARKNLPLAEVIQKAELVVPDGAGVVFYLRLFGYQQARCPGIELAESIINKLGQSSEYYTVYFYGASQEVVAKASQYWLQQFPNLIIKAYNGYLSSVLEQELLRDLAETQPNLILVGLGVPRQEFWIDQHRHLCPKALWMGVGGSFDIWSGTKLRAPAFFCKNNLEWLYRLYKEPYRWYRMLALPKFFFASLVKRLF